VQKIALEALQEIRIKYFQTIDQKMKHRKDKKKTTKSLKPMF
jgi:hypothetical protein